MSKEMAAAFRDCLSSPNVADSNMEQANIVDAIDNLARGAWSMSRSITARAQPGPDAFGGNVGSLTEAVMGITAGLASVADAINNLADAVREGK